VHFCSLVHPYGFQAMETKGTATFLQTKLPLKERKPLIERPPEAGRD